MTELATPLPYYVPRDPPTAEFVTWATGSSKRRRLRSLIGPPGAGKTTYLLQLEADLRQQAPRRAIVLWLTVPKDGGSQHSLSLWLEEQAQTLSRHYQFPRFINDRTVPFEAAWYVFVELVRRNSGAIPVVFLVDGLDEVSVRQRMVIELLLAIFLNRLGSDDCIVVTRRDADALNEAMLRWEEEVLPLAPLATPEKQIELRLQVAGQGAVSWRREPWEVELDWWIATLDEDGREAILKTLRPVLTPNPYMNSWLLNRVKKGTTTFGQNDFRDCLADYLTHAGLRPEEYLQPLIALGQDDAFRDSGVWFRRDYSGAPLSLIEPLLEAGVAENKGKEHYRFEPGVVALICRILGVEAPQG